MPDAVALQEPVAQTPGVTEADLDKMTEAQLQDFLKSQEGQESSKDTKTEPPKVTDGKPADKPAGDAQKPAETQWIEIDVDDPVTNTQQKLRFRSDADLRKSFAHAQKLLRSQKATIDKYNAERGQVGEATKSLQDAQTQIQSLQSQINQLTQGAQQVARGQSPNAYTTNALQSLMAQPGSMGQGQQDLVLQEIQALKNTQAQWQEKISRLEGLEQQFAAKQQEALVDTEIKSLYSEVGGFQTKHPEFQTSEDFAKLDDIVSTYGEELAKSMMSEDDWAKYSAVMQVVGLQKADKSGKFDLTRQNYGDLEEAFMIYQHRTGARGQALAEAKKDGIKAVEQVLTRQAQSATTIPNTIAGAKPPEMGPAEAEAILNMPVEKIQASKELQSQFRAACKAIGINPDLVLGPEPS
jgi:hypothetical protein